MSAYYKNVGALSKCWRFMKMVAFYENVGAILKCWCFTKMLALFENVVALLKCWHFIEMSAHVDVLWKCCSPMKIPASYENVGTLSLYTTGHIQQLSTKQGNIVFDDFSKVTWLLTFLLSFPSSAGVSPCISLKINPSSFWYLLLLELRIFWCFLSFQVMAILCCVAKNSLRGTTTLILRETWIVYRKVGG